MTLSAESYHDKTIKIIREIQIETSAQLNPIKVTYYPVHKGIAGNEISDS